MEVTSQRVPTSWSGDGAKDWFTYMNCKEKEKGDGVLTGNTEESICSQKFFYNLLAYNRV